MSGKRQKELKKSCEDKLGLGTITQSSKSHSFPCIKASSFTKTQTTDYPLGYRAVTMKFSSGCQWQGEGSFLNRALIIYTTWHPKWKATFSRCGRITRLEVPQKFPVFSEHLIPQLQKKGIITSGFAPIFCLEAYLTTLHKTQGFDGPVDCGSGGRTQKRKIFSAACWGRRLVTPQAPMESNLGILSDDESVCLLFEMAGRIHDREQNTKN